MKKQTATEKGFNSCRAWDMSRIGGKASIGGNAEREKPQLRDSANSLIYMEGAKEKWLRKSAPPVWNYCKKVHCLVVLFLKIYLPRIYEKQVLYKTTTNWQYPGYQSHKMTKRDKLRRIESLIACFSLSSFKFPVISVLRLWYPG